MSAPAVHSIAERYDRALRYARTERLLAHYQKPQPTAAW